MVVNGKDRSSRWLGNAFQSLATQWKSKCLAVEVLHNGSIILLNVHIIFALVLDVVKATCIFMFNVTAGS